jgi:hypothetical protein
MHWEYFWGLILQPADNYMGLFFVCVNFTLTKEALKSSVTFVVFPNTLHVVTSQTKNKTPWTESASEIYRPRDRRLLTK